MVLVIFITIDPLLLFRYPETANFMKTSSATPSGTIFPSGLAFNADSSDAEEMRDQSVFWSYEHRQFSKGSFQGKISAFHTSRLQLTLSQRSPGFFARGGLPAETTIISMPLFAAGSLHYRGQLLEDFQVLALSHTEELELYSSFASSMLTVAVSTALLEQQAIVITGNPLASLRCQERLLMDPDDYYQRMEYLVALLHSLQGGEWRSGKVEEELLEKDILETIFLGVQTPGPTKKMADRLSIARKAETHIRKNLRRSLSIHELCRVLGTAERTLHLGFKERFGVSPKAYHQIMRLNGVRYELLSGNPCKMVTDAALDWGYRHLGRFSEQYSRMFDELPSETRDKTVMNS